MAIFAEFEVIDGLIIQSLIKSNTYTETYRVVDENENPYFLKVFIPQKMPSRLINDSTGWVHEIEYSQNISHRNIISHISHGKISREDGIYQYYVTNYFNGRILADVISTNGKLSEEDALKIFDGILSGLNYLHTSTPALCHNDLDPSNILVADAPDYHPMIIDLGHLSTRCSGIAEFDTSDLDLLYHAQETRISIFDELGDVFSACATLYTMLTGSAPWKIDTPAEGSFKERFSELAQYRKANPIDFKALNVSDKVRYILAKGLELKALNRFQSIKEVIDALHNDATGEEPKREEESTTSKFSDGEKSGSSSNDDPNPVNFEIKRGGGNGFKDIAGMAELKDYLYKHVIFVIKDKEIAEKYRITPPNGMLLYGPPGCGKTFFAEKFAEETGFNFLLIKASDVGSSYVHGSQEKISKLFKLAEKNAPIVLCFDEFDALVPDRSTFGIQSQAGEVNEFLSQMNNCAKRGIFIVATSNRPDKIDPAVLRTGRIDKNVYVPLPDYEARKEMFSLYLAKRPTTDDINIEELAANTEGYIASDIAFIVNDAAMTAAYTRELITHDLLSTSLRNIRPSLRKESIDYYDCIRDTMEMTNRSNNVRATVGFNLN